MLSKLHIPVAHGRLEALLEEPETPRAIAVVCHPHPLYGGTMNNNVVYRLAKALVRNRVVALRFNFRGVGTSTGTYGEGAAEHEDVAAAIDFLSARHPGLPAWVTGVSFGARVGMAFGCQDARVRRLIGVGLVPRLFDFGFLERCDKPKALIHGAEDELAGLDTVRALADTMAEPKIFLPVDGAMHLFPGKLDEFESAAERAIAFVDQF